MIKAGSAIFSAVMIAILYLLTWLVVYFLFPLFHFSHTMISILFADIAATVLVFVFSKLFNNSSIYDPYWSVVPP
ncbi:MAG TPA: hypothetical protein VN249_03310, partial [Prolixibacteraceae bacterium]|nr:hypothetical protein [Prolixibacteraceae bacterium]